MRRMTIPEEGLKGSARQRPAGRPPSLDRLVLALIRDPRDRDDFLVLAGIEDLHATGAARR